ncbi:MAG TPA: DUF2723 domain-containing protein [Gemmatimonadales bacterium]|nr:DUF2723 domain-containing protein [Gemmatimonadales bacterium]
MTSTESDIAAQRPPYLMAAAVTLATLVLYVATLAPTAQFWDTPEYIAAAYVLGVPHPPGNPLFVILAHTWGLVPWMQHYAARINLMSAVMSALTAGFWFLIGERWLRPIIPALWPRRVTALAGTVMAATAFTVWNQSVVNEKVYTVSLLSIALVLWLAVRWGDEREGSGRDHHLLVIVYLLALTATNHLMGLLVAPAVVVYVLYTDPKVFISPKFLAWAAVAVVLGVSLWLFLLLRSPHFPAINEGEPTSWAALDSVLNRTQYAKPPVTQRQADFSAQLGMWLQYFSWQWGRDWAAGVQRALASLFGLLGVVGAWRHWKADKRSAMAMTALMVTLVPLLVFYLNFKYGFSQYPDRPTLPREVRERDYFFIVSFAVWGLWAAMGLAALMEWVQSALRERVPDANRRWGLATPVLLVALVPLAGNRLSAPRSGEWLARDFAYDMLQSCDPYAVLVTAGDNDTFPLWYAQEVEHIRQDVTVLNLSLANTDWYDRQLQRRPLATFDSASAPAIWRTRSYPKPAGPLWNLSIPALDSIPPYYEMQEKRGLNLAGFDIVLDPQRLGRPWIERADVMVLRAIQDDFGKRPIVFARTVAGYPDRFGLTANLVGQGMVRVLVPSPVVVNDTIKQSNELGLVNLPRSRALLEQVYHAHTAARHRPKGWIDVPSENIPATYAFLYQTLGLMLLQTARPEAMKLLAQADSMVENTSYGRPRAQAP